MGALTLADWLQDFGERVRPVENAAYEGKLHAVRPSLPPEPDPAAITASAVAAAEAALRAELDAHHEGRAEADRARHAEELADLIVRLGAEAGAAIAVAFEAAEARVARLATASAARILGKLAGDDLARRSLDHMARSIADALADARAVRVRVRGPRPLWEALAASLGDRAASLDYAEAPGFDLVVHLDERILETRLAEWSSVLDELAS